ncbi:MAG: hypothetical protein IKX20_08620 [Paludibacteraceae bacterium]|nr:hypothetical protein [Paludibacteraceae bacterium]
MKELSKVLWLGMFIACTWGWAFLYLVAAYIVVMLIWQGPKMYRHLRELYKEQKELEEQQKQRETTYGSEVKNR